MALKYTGIGKLPCEGIPKTFFYRVLNLGGWGVKVLNFLNFVSLLFIVRIHINTLLFLDPILKI